MEKQVQLDPQTRSIVREVAKEQEHARPLRHQLSASLVDVEEDSVAAIVDLSRDVLHVSQQPMVIVRHALKTTTCLVMAV